MTIQFKTDKSIDGSEEFTTQFVAQISEELSRYYHHINKIKVYLCDDDLQDGHHANSCLLEAVVEGQDAFEISSSGNTPEQTINRTLSELKRKLNVSLGSGSKK